MNKLFINLRINYMLFYRVKIKRFVFVQLCHAKFTKFLIVIIDENINWTNHVQYIINKISKSIANIKKNYYLKQLNYSFICPYLTYSIKI